MVWTAVGPHQAGTASVGSIRPLLEVGGAPPKLVTPGGVVAVLRLGMAEPKHLNQVVVLDLTLAKAVCVLTQAWPALSFS